MKKFGCEGCEHKKNFKGPAMFMCGKCKSIISESNLNEAPKWCPKLLLES